MSLKLGSICGVTLTVPDLGVVEAAYTGFLGMRVAARGTVDIATASGWGCPAAAGCRTLILLPETGEETSLRFVEDPAAGTAPAFVTHGWNATEITVQDTDALAARLAGSPFRIIGPPANLTGFKWIRAMQVLGPAGECLYLTHVGGDASLAAARGPVGQVFITVVGGPSIADLIAFYRAGFDNPVSDPVAIPIGVLNTAHGLPDGGRHELALVELPDGTRIELDQYPPSATPRPTVPGHLPPGMSLVSFNVDLLPADGLIAAPVAGSQAPFQGRLTGSLRGAAGELIELCSRLG